MSYKTFNKDDVKRVANRYLTRDNVTVGHYRGQANAEQS